MRSMVGLLSAPRGARRCGLASPELAGEVGDLGAEALDGHGEAHQGLRGASVVGVALASAGRRVGLGALEGRDAIGGTWDLFNYPGIRSDSDMYTLGYAFKPWRGDNAIADGASILDAVKEALKA